MQGSEPIYRASALPGPRRDEAAAQHAVAHRATLVRAQIVHCEDPIAPADHTDLPLSDIDNPHLLRRKFIGRANIDAHALTIWGAGSSASLQP